MELAKMLWWRHRSDSAATTDSTRSVQKIASLSRDLLSDSGGIAAVSLASDILRIYKSLNQADRRVFFRLLVADFSPNPDDVGRAADAYRQEPSALHLRQLQRVVEPPRQELFRRLNMAPDGTRELIEIRRHVLNELDTCPESGARSGGSRSSDGFMVQQWIPDFGADRLEFIGSGSGEADCV